MNIPEKMVCIPRMDRIMAIMAFWYASSAPKPVAPLLKSLSSEKNAQPEQ
jgi:hypothetical protein